MQAQGVHHKTLLLNCELQECKTLRRGGSINFHMRAYLRKLGIYRDNGGLLEDIYGIQQLFRTVYPGAFPPVRRSIWWRRTTEIARLCTIQALRFRRFIVLVQCCAILHCFYKNVFRTVVIPLYQIFSKTYSHLWEEPSLCYTEDTTNALPTQ